MGALPPIPDTSPNMPQKPSGSDRTETDVRDRLDAIRRQKAERVRWDMSRHTAERAMEAIKVDDPPARLSSSKSRRRKRHKRLL
jgi:hypothetical protein